MKAKLWPAIGALFVLCAAYLASPAANRLPAGDGPGAGSDAINGPSLEDGSKIRLATGDKPDITVPPVPAQPLAVFLESMCTGANYNPVRDVSVPLAYLGVRVNRIFITSAAQLAHHIAIHKATIVPGVHPGIKNILLTNSKTKGPSISQYIELARSLAAADAFIGLEGINEPGNQLVQYNGVDGGKVGDKRATWAPVAMFMRDLYAAAKTDPVVKAYPVFGVSEAGAAVDNVGIQFNQIPPGGADPTLQATYNLPDGTVYSDYLNAHNYVTGTAAGRGIVHANQAWDAATKTVRTQIFDDLPSNNGSVTWARHFPGYPSSVLPAIPAVTTETGWHTGEGADFVDEYTQGVLLLNVYFAQFRRGFRYTCQYEMADGYSSPGQTWGMFDHFYKPKLSATFIHNLTSILQDMNYGALKGLPYHYSAPSTFHDLLLQRSDGRFFLVVWNERVPKDSGTDSVPIDLGKSFSTVNIYDPTIGTGVQTAYTNMRNLKLEMTDHPLILELAD